MRLASQAVDLGSQDTEGEDEPDDTQAYLLDSDLRDFIAGDDEQIDAPESSLPSLDLGNFGAGTQAVLRSAKKAKRPRKMEKIFTSDLTEVDVAMSSDSDEQVPLQGPTRVKLIKKTTYTVDSASQGEDESEEDQPALLSRKRIRRVVDEDDEDE
jgi:ATP-dependent DNA helicase MPH1